MEDITESILFASNDLLVRRVTRAYGGGKRGEVCFVTFDPYTDQRRLERPGFGENYFRPRGIDAIHILSRDNRWYHHAELPAALAAVQAATAGYAQVIAYGSSMGGYAALHYGAACGAAIGIALSPQYSVDRAIAPFENRWAEDIARIAFHNHPIAPPPAQYILYDPRDALDRQHFALFAARAPVIGLRIPYAGHPVGGYLNETGMFEPLFDAVRAGTLDPPAFEAELRARRRQSGQYLFTLAQRVPRRRDRQKIALARMAVAANADDPTYLSYLGHVLDLAGEHDEARQLHLRAVARSEGHLHALHNLLVHHERIGDYPTALQIAETLVAGHPGVRMVHRSRDRIRRKLRPAGPLLRLARLLRLVPG